jgi:Family of unknown function (DUF6455)
VLERTLLSHEASIAPPATVVKKGGKKAQKWVHGSRSYLI